MLFDEINVDGALFPVGGGGYPGIGYNSLDGLFIINADAWDKEPQPVWEWNDTENYWTTRLVRLLPILERKRVIVEREGVFVAQYPVFTRWNKIRAEHGEDVEMTPHTQVLSVLANKKNEPVWDRLVVLGMRRTTSTRSWDNPAPGQRGHWDKMPTGVVPLLENWRDEILQKHGAAVKIPIWCFWWIDLVQAERGGKPATISLGTGRNVSQVIPFTLYMGNPSVWPIADHKGGVTGRFVDPSVSERAQELRKLHMAAGWHEWRVETVEEGMNGEWDESDDGPPF